MIFKLTSQQAPALKHLFEKMIIIEPVDNVAESLVKDLMIQVYKKLRDKLEAKMKDAYSLSLNDQQAKAFYLYFQNRSLGPHWVYEQTIVNAKLLELDRMYA